MVPLQRRLADLRSDLGVSNRRVATALGVAVQTVRAWDREEREPSVAHAAGYALELGYFLIVARDGEFVMDVPLLLADPGAFRRREGLTQEAHGARLLYAPMSMGIAERRMRRRSVRLSTVCVYLSGMGCVLDLLPVALEPIESCAHAK